MNVKLKINNEFKIQKNPQKTPSGIFQSYVTSYEIHSCHTKQFQSG